jgi:hypothetical protein
MSQGPGRLAEVLERVPEDDRRPVPVHVFDRGVADVRSGCVRFETDGFAAASHEGRGKGSVAGSHIKDRAGRHEPVQAIGER